MSTMLLAIVPEVINKLARVSLTSKGSSIVFGNTIRCLNGEPHKYLHAASKSRSMQRIYAR